MINKTITDQHRLELWKAEKSDKYMIINQMKKTKKQQPQ